MKEYKEAEIEVLQLESDDIVTASDPFKKTSNEMDIFKSKDLP